MPAPARADNAAGGDDRCVVCESDGSVSDMRESNGSASGLNPTEDARLDNNVNQSDNMCDSVCVGKGPFLHPNPRT